MAACTCLQMTAAEAFEAAHLVVEGVVIGKSAPERASVTYTVAVERVPPREDDVRHANAPCMKPMNNATAAAGTNEAARRNGGQPPPPQKA